MDSYLEGQDHHYKTGFHGKPLIIAWLPLVNFAVLCAAIKWCRYTFYMHVILGLGVIALTLLSTIHILIDDWLSPNQDFKIQKIHNIAGLAVTIWVVFQVISGILARVIQYSPNVRTNTCVWIKRIHHISSYLIMLVSKFNYLNIKFMKGKYAQFAEYFLIQMVFLVIYLWIKSCYWTLSQQIIDGQLTIPIHQERRNKIICILLWFKQRFNNIKIQILQKSFNVPQVYRTLPILQSESEIPVQNYILFNDVVYDINNLNYLHPGGQYVINLMRTREINRFLYGYYRPQNDHNIITHVHTKQSLRLCGQPVAKIERISPMQGFDRLAKFKLVQSRQIGQLSYVHLVYLRPAVKQSADWIKLNYNGYKLQSQIGQHLSLTICNKNGRKRCTRLYTSVWFMRPSNIEFMQRNFPNSTKIFCHNEQIQFKENQSLIESLIETETNSSLFQYAIKEEIVPLVIKKHSKGELTSRLLADQFKGEIVLSTPMGAGMNYQELKDQGRVILISGGTGILPFCDLIDLLFKRVKILQNSNISSEIRSRDPIVNYDIIKKRSFTLYYAVQNSSDLIPIVLYQLNHLCASSTYIDFNVVFKIKQGVDMIKQELKLFKYQSQSFNEQIQTHLLNENQKQQINKIYICGPYRMNQDLSKIFSNYNVDKQLYHFM